MTPDPLVVEGTRRRLHDELGAHVIEHQGVPGVHFAVWAPNALQVSVVGDGNHWDGRHHVMRRADAGVWEIFVPDLVARCAYYYEIVGLDGAVQPLKADPFAFAASLHPGTASITTDAPRYIWSDADYQAHWASVDPRRVPISIYEVHAGSWDRADDGGFLSWDQLTERLIPYVVDLGFTHIELMPIGEYFDESSLGYQATGLYAPSARFGDHEGFARFVDGAHRAGIGVLLDWTPAHFPVDAHSLVRFDGTTLYEHDDPQLGVQPDGSTAIYNFGRPEVTDFLVDNALFWAGRYHVDGLRIDAVAAMLYRDYGRTAGERSPNAEGGGARWDAVEFLRAMHDAVHAEYPGMFTIAEESTAWPGVTLPVHEGGLGFDFKWNRGWVHDTLQYFGREAADRREHHDEITFGISYAYAENFVLPLGHDEMVHGKGSMLARMAGDDRAQFANLRALYGLMWGHPGKKLLFMGQEFAQRREWSEARALDWPLRANHAHEGVRNLVRDLNRLYRAKPALHGRDCEIDGFAWLVADDAAQAVFAWERRSPGEPSIAVIANLMPVARAPYRVPLPTNGHWREIFNSDAAAYGGTNLSNAAGVIATDGSAWVTLPPLATIMLEAA